MKKLLILLLLAPLVLFVIWQLIPPSHNRDWREDYTKLPTIEFEGSSFTVSNLRNWSYGETGEATSKEWVDVTIAKEDVEKLFFILEPFGDYGGIAHTMLAVTLEDGSGYVMSIEARREVGETYQPLKATLWPTYEYLFVWTTERDMYGNSQYFANDQLYMYELDLTSEQAWTVVQAIAEETQAVAEKPRWYNTLFANCTNVLARTLNQKTNANLPWNIARVLPGYSEEYLFEQDLFKKDGSLESLTASGHISPFVDEAYTQVDSTSFSIQLRELMRD